MYLAIFLDLKECSNLYKGPGEGTRRRDQEKGPGEGTRRRDQEKGPGEGTRRRGSNMKLVRCTLQTLGSNNKQMESKLHTF
jgi:hypothetical protein